MCLQLMSVRDIGIVNLELVNEVQEISPEEMIFELVLDKRRLRLSSMYFSATFCLQDEHIQRKNMSNG